MRDNKDKIEAVANDYVDLMNITAQIAENERVNTRRRRRDVISH